MENILIGEKDGKDYLIKGIVDRNYAEKNQIRHFTGIFVVYIIGSKEWVVHDRFDKIAAKKLAVGEVPPSRFVSINLCGGHVSADKSSYNLIGTAIDENLLLKSLRKEISEELLLQAKSNESATEFEIWENSKFTGKNFNAVPYDVPLDKIQIAGFAEYSHSSNMEYSFVAAMGITEDDYKKIEIGDDYKKDKQTHNILLKKRKFSEDELVAMMKEGNPQVEICDAITRLFDPINKETLDNLRKIINGA